MPQGAERDAAAQRAGHLPCAPIPDVTWGWCRRHGQTQTCSLACSTACRRHRVLRCRQPLPQVPAPPAPLLPLLPLLPKLLLLLLLLPKLPLLLPSLLLVLVLLQLLLPP